jgi:hypothetical protein
MAKKKPVISVSLTIVYAVPIKWKLLRRFYHGATLTENMLPWRIWAACPERGGFNIPVATEAFDIGGTVHEQSGHAHVGVLSKLAVNHDTMSFKVLPHSAASLALGLRVMKVDTHGVGKSLSERQLGAILFC